MDTGLMDARVGDRLILVGYRKEDVEVEVTDVRRLLLDVTTLTRYPQTITVRRETGQVQDTHARGRVVTGAQRAQERRLDEARDVLRAAQVSVPWGTSDARLLALAKTVLETP